MYISKYWGNFIGGSDDSLNLVAFLEDLKKEEIPLSEIFAKIGNSPIQTVWRWTSILLLMWSLIWPPSCWSAALTAV